ncbi:hypothetical protein A0H81_08001 [Grifola frondosa]|uniref:Uncharacterized protein n=1 Tax=Grifola frondosa TaxID=5627 RepID=A0A1C7M790_GRIFR|nr:hypothetical protein A0H81_08001 [Grifola frondosa]
MALDEVPSSIAVGTVSTPCSVVEQSHSVSLFATAKTPLLRAVHIQATSSIFAMRQGKAFSVEELVQRVVEATQAILPMEPTQKTSKITMPTLFGSPDLTFDISAVSSTSTSPPPTPTHGFSLPDTSPRIVVADNDYQSDCDPQLCNLAQRRGFKGLPILQTSLMIASKANLLSPLTPETASSFASRFAGSKRPPSSPEPDYFDSDPLCRGAGSFFADRVPNETRATVVSPHPDIYDLSIYTCRASRRPRQSNDARRLKKPQPHTKGSILDEHPRTNNEPSLPCTTIESSTTQSALDRPKSNRAPILPLSSASLPHPAITATTTATTPLPLRDTLLPRPITTLRPLVLPQQVARRESYHQDLDIQPAAHSHSHTPRPLLLPLQLARRASACATSTPAPPRLLSPEDSASGSGGPATEQRHSQQIDDIILLLDGSGIIREGPAEEAPPSRDAPPLDTSPPILPLLQPENSSSSSFSLVVVPTLEDQDGEWEDAGAQMREQRLSRQIEDILELLDQSAEDHQVVGDSADARQDGEEPPSRDEQCCTYAI